MGTPSDVRLRRIVRSSMRVQGSVFNADYRLLPSDTVAIRCSIDRSLQLPEKHGLTSIREEPCYTMLHFFVFSPFLAIFHSNSSSDPNLNRATRLRQV